MASHSSIAPEISSSLLPPASSNQRNVFAVGAGKKNGLRPSSSLQDFSKFHEECLEDANRLVHSKPPDSLQRGGVNFSKEKGLSSISFTRKKWLLRLPIGLLCLALFVFSIYICSIYFSKPSQFYVILDCGSTGTRVYVYEWSIGHDKSHRNLPFVLRSLPEGPRGRPNSESGRAYRRMETEPGFHNLVGNMSGLRSSIRPLLRWAEKQIPENDHKSTWVFLYATAGVRRLSPSNSEWLLDKAWSILEKSSFHCQREWVKVITGMEEAYFGWIALNYQTNMLGSSPTYGALDLGGSSLQVTFEAEQLVLDDTSLDVHIGAVSHHLSAFSLPNYGLNDAFDRSVVHLLKKLNGSAEAGGKIELKHPCLQAGYKQEYICSQCQGLVQQGIPLMENLSSATSGSVIELLGAPQWKECRKLAKIVVNLSEWSPSNPAIDCQLQPCALSDDFTRPHGKFYAMSGFFVVFRFFNLTSDATLDDVLRKGWEFCEMPWQVAKDSVVPQPAIDQYCFRAPYIVSLLRDGLHITDDEVIVESGSITWTLGVALLESGQALLRAIELSSYRKLFMKLSPAILIGEGKVKTASSSTPRSLQRSSGMGSSSVQSTDSSLTSNILHSYSLGNLGLMQSDNGAGSFSNSLRSQVTVLSRRSQSREDLNCNLTELPIDLTRLKTIHMILYPSAEKFEFITDFVIKTCGSWSIESRAAAAHQNSEHISRGNAKKAGKVQLTENSQDMGEKQGRLAEDRMRRCRDSMSANLA
ncbi:hypothetical protein ACLOJK_016668 [Asimina triloba]